MLREQICCQQSHCLSCHISVLRTGKDCRELTEQEIRRYGGKEMYIDGKWYEEPEINAYVRELKERIRTLEAAESLLRIAVKDIAIIPCNNNAYHPSSCDVCSNKDNCDYTDSFKWRYADEAIKLLKELSRDE